MSPRAGIYRPAKRLARQPARLRVSSGSRPVRRVKPSQHRARSDIVIGTRSGTLMMLETGRSIECCWFTLGAASELCLGIVPGDSARSSSGDSQQCRSRLSLPPSTMCFTIDGPGFVSRLLRGERSELPHYGWNFRTHPSVGRRSGWYSLHTACSAGRAAFTKSHTRH